MMSVRAIVMVLEEGVEKGVKKGRILNLFESKKLLVIFRNYEIIRTTFQENWSNSDNYLTIAVFLALKFSLC